MPKTRPLNPAEFAAYLERVGDLRDETHALERELSAALLLSSESPIPYLEHAAQTLNGTIEALAGVQRMVLARVLLDADKRRLEVELKARAEA
jgi:hypothetical protein